MNIVYPILKEKNYPFTIYLVSKILRENPWVWWIEAWSQLEKIDKIFFEGNTLKLDSEFLKTKFFEKLKKKLKRLTVDDQKKLIREIFSLKELSDMKSIFLNSNDIDILIKDDLVTIGSHA